MAVAKIRNNTYTVDLVWQWDKNQTLEIYGLNIASVPEIHFSNNDMERAIVRQATKDAAGVIRAEIPNSLLQKPYKIKAYICTYEGNTFEVQHALEIPVKARNKPYDYTFEDTAGEVYSYNDFENRIVNVERDLAETKAIYSDIYACNENAQDAAKVAQESSHVAEYAMEEARQAANEAAELAEFLEPENIMHKSAFDPYSEVESAGGIPGYVGSFFEAADIEFDTSNATTNSHMNKTAVNIAKWFKMGKMVFLTLNFEYSAATQNVAGLYYKMSNLPKASGAYGAIVGANIPMQSVMMGDDVLYPPKNAKHIFATFSTTSNSLLINLSGTGADGNATDTLLNNGETAYFTISGMYCTD